MNIHNDYIHIYMHIHVSKTTSLLTSLNTITNYRTDLRSVFFFSFSRAMRPVRLVRASPPPHAHSRLLPVNDDYYYANRNHTPTSRPATFLEYTRAGRRPTEQYTIIR